MTMINITEHNVLKVASDNRIVFVDLRLDYAFKLIFGTPGNEDLLLLLVNAILPENDIKAVTLNSQENMGLRRNARKSVFDISCTTSKGERLEIEMQYKSQDDFEDRMVFYASFPIINSLRAGKIDSYAMAPLYMIGITNFILQDVKENDRLINYYRILNLKNKTIEFTDSVNYVTVELPKFNKTIEELITPADKIFYTLANIHEMVQMPPEFAGSGLEKLYELCRFAAMDLNIQMDYVREFMAQVDERSRLRTARNEGIKEGRAEAIDELIVKLRRQGVSEEVIAAVTK